MACRGTLPGRFEAEWRSGIFALRSLDTQDTRDETSSKQGVEECPYFLAHKNPSWPVSS